MDKYEEETTEELRAWVMRASPTSVWVKINREIRDSTERFMLGIDA